MLNEYYLDITTIKKIKKIKIKKLFKFLSKNAVKRLVTKYKT